MPVARLRRTRCAPPSGAGFSRGRPGESSLRGRRFIECTRCKEISDVRSRRSRVSNRRFSHRMIVGLFRVTVRFHPRSSGSVSNRCFVLPGPSVRIRLPPTLSQPQTGPTESGDKNVRTLTTIGSGRSLASRTSTKRIAGSRRIPSTSTGRYRSPAAIWGHAVSAHAERRPRLRRSRPP
jgi:hypothetical protein